MTNFRPIHSHRLAGQVASLISTKILEGQMVPGSKIPPERELAVTFKVSRPTVREAIHVLEALGLLEVRHGAGSYVSKNPSVLSPRMLKQMLDRDDELLLEMVNVRKEFETRNAELAAENASRTDIRRLAKILDDAATDIRLGNDETEREIDFHIMIADASHNRIRLFITTLMLVAHAEKFREARLRQMKRQHGAVEDFWREHRTIYVGIEGRDPKRAKAAMLAHLAAAHARQVALVEET